MEPRERGGAKLDNELAMAELKFHDALLLSIKYLPCCGLPNQVQATCQFVGAFCLDKSLYKANAYWNRDTPSKNGMPECRQPLSISQTGDISSKLA